MTTVELLALAGTGIVAGWVNVMAAGGSMLTVPMLVFLGLSGPSANGTNRVAIIAQNIAAVAAFSRGGFANVRLALVLSLAAVPGAIVGASVGVKLDGVWFDRLLAVTLAVMLIWMLWPHKGGATAEHQTGAPISRQRWAGGLALMFIAGAWGGFIQIGVGFLLMPILHRVLGLDLVRVNALKVLIVLLYMGFALFVYARSTEIYWLGGAALAAGMATGGWLGAHTTLRGGEVWVRRVFAGVIVVIAARLLLFGS
ncbi:MAG: sulfite exporter TauE/SafE family protein [Pseudomonadota bacterium]